MRRILFLDDVRNIDDVRWGFFDLKKQRIEMSIHCPQDIVYTVRNFEQFSQFLDDEATMPERLGPVDIISFDHDLCDEHYAAMIKDNDSTFSPQYSYGSRPTGLECLAMALVFYGNSNIQSMNLYCHSLNGHGQMRMANLVDHYKKHGRIT